MNMTERMRNTRWVLAECHLIAQAAYGRFIEIEPWQIHDQLDLWREWYYGLVPTSVILARTAARQVQVSGM